MTYPKKIMRMSELKKMGFPESYLLNVYADKNQRFAWKLDVAKSNSPILFETDSFEEYRINQINMDRLINSHSPAVI